MRSKNTKKNNFQQLMRKSIATVLVFAMWMEMFAPYAGYAQSSSPEQIETQGSSAGSAEAVDLFTGDFHYSIPLMEIEGYPINLNYDANVNMNQEASWVGLGWNLNVGSITRDMRGLPDDFNGDQVKKETGVKADETSGKNIGGNLAVSAGWSFWIADVYAGIALEFKSGKFNNTYSGKGKNWDLNLNLNVGLGAVGNSAGGSATLGFSRNTQTGIGVTYGFASQLQYGIGYWGVTFGATRREHSTTTVRNSRTGRTRYKSFNTGEQKLIQGTSKGASREISFGTRTYIPKFNNGITQTTDFTRKANGAFLIWVWAMGIKETYSYDNHLTVSSENIPSYGYLNLQNSSAHTKRLMDYNRENEGPVNERMGVMPVTNLTYDLFTMSTGLDQGQFRAHRNDIGTVSNTKQVLDGHGANYTKERGFGAGFKKITIDGGSITDGKSEEMDQYNANYSNETYKNVYGSSAISETFYFKEIGELTPLNTSLFNQWGERYPVKRSVLIFDPASIVNLFTTGMRPGITGGLNGYNFISGSTPSYSAPTSNTQTGKTERATLYQSLNAQEATSVGFNTTITSYPSSITSINTGSATSSNRVTSYKKNHHLSEMTVVRPDGSRYIFNVPAYSLKEKQVVFNASGNSTTCGRNEINYSGTDNSAGNTKGRDNLYTVEEIPAYAHSFLLGAVLSDDYNDLTGNGLSEDDMGNYIKFNHTRVYGEDNPFKWRSPYKDGGSSSAFYIQNNLSYTDDELGLYNYGEKEVWYPHSIEGKNYIAYFVLTARDDLFSVSDENGTRDNGKPGYKLEKIVLYSKEDIRQNGLSNAEPLQTVEFEYDYSLCKNFSGNKNNGAGDNTSGKLTLNKIRFSGSKSKKGRLNPYVFTYNSGTKNPNYNPMSVDRWGIYKNNTCSGTWNFSNAEFPYSDKSKTNRDANSQCWLLNEIKLPGGGKMNVEFESDDYASVENRKAMEMFKVIGMNRHTNITSYPTVSTSLTKPGDKKKTNDVMYVQLDQNLSASTSGAAKDEFFEKYIKGIYNSNNRMYYRFLVRNKSGSTEAEWVHGFATIQEWGVVGSYPYNVGYIKIGSTDVDNRGTPYEVNPIMYQGWQNLRTNVSRAIYPDDGSGTLPVDLGSLMHGINRSLNNNKYCREMVPNYSMVRLTNPDNKKMGGGNRVKKITYTDNWAAMSTESSFTYGTEYFYDTNGDGTGTSTGVATYEPTVGNEENPFRQPVEYIVDNDKLPDDKLFHMGPFGESLMNGPGIGYGKVTTRSIGHTDVTHNATGKTVHEFYTAKDYPTLLNRTTLSIQHYDNDDVLTPAAIAFLGIPQMDFLVSAQGFAVEKNDMHGNPRKITHYNAAGNEVHSSEYKYKGFWDDFKVVDRDGNVSNAKLGKDLDIVVDANITETFKYDFGETKTKTYSIIPDFNTSTYQAKKVQVFTSHVITKTIQHYSVMNKVVERYNGSETTTEMLAFDKHTGQVLVSSNTNEYEKPVYTASVPAYWYYTGMGPAADTYNNHFSGINISSGTLSFTSITGSVNDYFLPGDELLLQNGSTLSRIWVLSTDAVANTMKVIDASGAAVGTYTGASIRVIRSGKRNIHSAPMQEVVLSEHNPVSGSRIDIDNNLLDATATEFLDYWSTICNRTVDCSGSTLSTSCTNEPNDIINPFTSGILGNWRMKRTYSYQVDLAETATSSPVYTRTGGRFGSFIPFFDYNISQNKWFPINESGHPNFDSSLEKWRKTGEAMRYDMNGNLVEAADALGIFSATQYGYNQSTRFLPVASADNSRLNQMGFDGFEDYTFASSFASSCLNKIHFGFSLSGTDLATDAHTGRYSLKVVPSGSFSMERKVELPCSPPEKYTLDQATGLFKLAACSCLPVFNPSPGEYTIGAWVKQALDNPVENYADAYIEVKVNTPSGWVTHTFSGSSSQPMVENWNRIEGTFDIPSGSTCIQVKLGNTGTANKNIYFDDVRVHPFNAGLAANVYDPLTLRLWSQLDGYNYASFMEYNENGSMVRVKRETERGIRTTHEIRSGLGK